MPVGPSPSTPEGARSLAATSAGAVVASRPGYLQASSDEAYIQHPVISSGTAQYVPYDRTYKGLSVVGGDFVMVTDLSGKTTSASVAQQRPIGSLSTVPTLS
jgi:hypothetical protein